jgi:hypothetical protein
VRKRTRSCGPAEQAAGGPRWRGATDRPWRSIGGADGRLKLPQGAVELAGDFAQAGVVAAEQFAVQKGEGGKQGEAEAKDQGDDRQSALGHRLGTGAIAGPVTAGMQEAVRERPVRREVIPPLVLDFPAAVSPLPYQGSGEDFGGQGIHPNPLVIGGLGLPPPNGSLQSTLPLFLCVLSRPEVCCCTTGAQPAKE